MQKKLGAKRNGGSLSLSAFFSPSLSSLHPGAWPLSHEGRRWILLHPPYEDVNLWIPSVRDSRTYSYIPSIPRARSVLGREREGDDAIMHRWHENRRGTGIEIDGEANKAGVTKYFERKSVEKFSEFLACTAFPIREET